MARPKVEISSVEFTPTGRIKNERSSWDEWQRVISHIESSRSKLIRTYTAATCIDLACLEVHAVDQIRLGSKMLVDYNKVYETPAIFLP